MPSTHIYETDNCVKLIFAIIIPDTYAENYSIFINNLI